MVKQPFLVASGVDVTEADVAIVSSFSSNFSSLVGISGPGDEVRYASMDDPINAGSMANLASESHVTSERLLVCL